MALGVLNSPASNRGSNRRILVEEAATEIDNAPANDGLERFYAADRAAWRAWLEEHSAPASSVWLIYHKQGSGKPCVGYAAMLPLIILALLLTAAASGS